MELECLPPKEKVARSSRVGATKTGKGQYGKLFEGLNGGPKIARYYWQCRCEGMVGSKFGEDGVLLG